MSSAWIKLDKNLSHCPKVLKIASRLSHADVTQVSRNRLMVIGALVTLWWYADTHIGEDDVLPIGADQVNDLVGIEGFCQLLPADWLQIIDADHVELVDWLEHNGTSAKKRALAQKRKQKQRAQQSKKSTVKSPSRHAHVTQQSRECPTDSVTRLDSSLKSSSSYSVDPLPHIDTQHPVPTAVARPAVEVGVVDRVFEHWRTSYHHPRAVLDAKRRRLIEARLVQYPEATLKLAIDGYKNVPHNMGLNDSATVYDDITLFLRDAEHVERGLHAAQRGAQLPLNAVQLARQRLQGANGHGRVESGRASDIEGECSVATPAGQLRG